MRPDREATLRRAQARVGTTLNGKWRLDYLVGLGGMASVYAATHRNRKRVAVKILHPELSALESVRERFQREGYVANTVGHPGVVSVDDDDVTEDGCAFLVMELIEGETLDTRLERRGPLTVREVLAYASQVLDTLGTAHQRGVVHRDLKPDNLLLGTNGVVKILDFGISRVRELSSDPSRTKAEGMLGTPAFMPPEQAKGLWDQVDAQSDLWAVGATMFTLLTGHLIHAAETPNEALALAMVERAPSPRKHRPDLDDDVAHIVQRALEYEKSERWPDAPTMLRAVREAYYAREHKQGPRATKAPDSARAPRVAWHRALEESWLSGDDRDTLESVPRPVDLAATPDVFDPARPGQAPHLPSVRSLATRQRPAHAAGARLLPNLGREDSGERRRGERAVTSSSGIARPGTPHSLSAPGSADDGPALGRVPNLSRHPHTTTARAVAASPRSSKSNRWSFALTLLGVVIVVLSVVITVRRSQNAADGRMENTGPSTAVERAPASEAFPEASALHSLQAEPANSPRSGAGAPNPARPIVEHGSPDSEVLNVNELPLLRDPVQGRPTLLPGAELKPAETSEPQRPTVTSEPQRSTNEAHERPSR